MHNPHHNKRRIRDRRWPRCRGQPQSAAGDLGIYMKVNLQLCDKYDTVSV